MTEIKPGKAMVKTEPPKKPKPRPKPQNPSLSSTMELARSSKKIKKIILHIGTRKTGSTSLQTILRDNQEAFREQGHNLVIAKGKSFKELYLSIIGGTPIWTNWIENSHKAAQEAGIDNLIITSEDLFYLNDWKIAEVVAFCKTLAEKIEVYAFIRRQDDYLESSYTQYTTAGLWVGNIQDDFDSFLSGTIKNLDYKYQISKWSEAVGKRNFHPTFFVKANTAQIFLNKVGLTIENQPSSTPRNIREPIDMLRASIAIGESVSESYGLPIHCFSKMNQRFEFRKRIRLPLARAFADLKADRTKCYFLKPQHMLTLEKEFCKTNEYLLSNFAGDHDESFADFSREGVKPVRLGIRYASKAGLEAVARVLSTELAILGKMD